MTKMLTGKWASKQAFYRCDKYHDQMKLWEESVYFLLNPTVHHEGKPEQEVKVRTWRRELEQRSWKMC